MFIKNTAGQFIHFQGVDSSTGGIKSGVSWTVRRCIDGTFAAATGTATEDGTTGWYKFAMSQADTNGNNIGFNFTGTGAVPQTVNIITTTLNPYDSVRFGMTALPNAAAEAAGGLYTRGTGAGQIAQDANGNVRVNVDTIKTNPVVNGGTITYPTNATLASTTNITSASGVTLNNGAHTITSLTATAGIAVTQSTLNGHGLSITGNGTGHGILATSGSGATGDGFNATAASTNGNGIKGVKTGSGVALAAPTTDIVLAKTTNITGFNDIAATAIVSSGAITTSGGAVSTVTTTGTATNVTTVNGLAANVITAASINAAALNGKGDWNVGKTGYSLTAGTGLGDQTANITGNLSGSVGSVTGAVGSVTGAVGSVTAAVTVGTNNDKTGYALTVAERASISDKLLGRNTAGGSDGGRTVTDALRPLRNKTAIAGGTLTVYQEDDVTPAWTAAVTTAASDPISSIDPV